MKMLDSKSVPQSKKAHDHENDRNCYSTFETHWSHGDAPRAILYILVGDAPSGEGL
jgi:hypothetical protein